MDELCATRLGQVHTIISLFQYMNEETRVFLDLC